MASDEGQEQKRGHLEATKKAGKDCSLCYNDGLVPTHELCVGAAVPKNSKVERYSEVML